MNYNSGGYMILDLSWYKKDIDVWNNPIKLPKFLIKQIKEYIRLKSTKWIHVLTYSSDNDDVNNIILKTFISSSISKYIISSVPNEDIYMLTIHGDSTTSAEQDIFFNLTRGEMSNTNAVWETTFTASVETQSLDTEESKKVKS